MQSIDHKEKIHGIKSCTMSDIYNLMYSLTHQPNAFVFMPT